MPTALGLLDWLDNPVATRGIRFRGNDGSWSRKTYRELADAVFAAAAALVEAGVRAGDVVPLVLPSGPDFVCTFFALLHLGATPSVLPLPWALRGTDGYTKQVGAIAAVIRPRHAVVAPRYRDVFPATPAIEVLAPRYADRADAVPRTDGELAIVQFTSGSRGNPRGVRISRDNLTANLHMLYQWMRDTGEYHGAVTWLPFYHDMGLVGGILFAVVNQVEHAVMSPEQFLRSPLGWLAEYDGAPYSTMVMPNFGFQNVLSRVRPVDVSTMDFSGIRTVISGAERVDPAVLARFSALLAPGGFDLGALAPAYGLAEGTLAVTGVPFGDVPRMVRVARPSRRLGEKVEVAETAALSTEPVADPQSWQVSCGPPFPGLDVEILDEDEVPQPDGVLGEIRIGGPSIAEGYVNGSTEDNVRLDGGRFRTGDAGFLLDGELYVVGRLGDSLKVHGQGVFVEDVEAEITAATGLPARKFAVAAGLVDGVPTVLVVAERTPPDRLAGVRDPVRVVAGDAVRVHLYSAAKGTIPLTSSGKPRRRELWTKYLAGEITGEEWIDDSTR